MSKLKSHRGAAKRFRRRASGSIKVRKGYRAHILLKKSSKVKRQRRANLTLKKCDQRAVNRMLDGC